MCQGSSLLSLTANQNTASPDVAYTLKPLVAADLDQLENSGVLFPVSHSERDAPNLPVIKKDGYIRVCGDFKMTLNPLYV